MARGTSEFAVSRRTLLGLAAGAAASCWVEPAMAGSQGAQRAPTVPWYGQELVRGHLSWLHPAWTRPERDFDARRWIDQFERAGFQSFVFYSKFHDGVCNWPSKLQDLKPERDFVGEITSEAHRRKMRVIIYYSGGPDDWAADRHPDWRCVRRDGSVAGPPAPGYKRWFKFAFCCPNSPYRDYLLGQITEILQTYDVDGFWIDVMHFPNVDPMDPERRHLGCFCKWCREKYSLRTGGASLFDIDGTPAQLKWEADCWREVFSAAKEIVRKKGADRSITYNGCGHVTTPYYWPDLQNLGDYLSVEGFQYAQVQIGSHCRLVRAGGKPYEIICVASGQTIGWTPKSTDLLLLEAAAVNAHGGTWCVAMDPTASGKIFDSQIDQVGQVHAYLRKQRDWLVNTTPVYDAAVFHTSYLEPRTVDPDSTLMNRISTGWPDLLLQRNILYGYLYPDTDFSSFPLLIIDDAAPISDGLVDRIAAYVKNGGRLLAELTQAQLESPAGQRLLSEVLGAAVLGVTGYEAVYVGGLDPGIAGGMTDMPTLVEGASYRVRPVSAQPLAYHVYPIAPWSLDRMTFAFHNPPSDKVSQDPAITLNRYGNGLAMFLACSLGNREVRRHQNVISDPQGDLPQAHEWALQLGENLVWRLIGEPLVKSEAPAGVEIVINRQEGRHIVHLLNNRLSPMLFSDNRSGRVTLADVSFGVNEKRIGAVREVRSADGTPVTVRHEGNWVRMTLPRLKVHQALALLH